MLKKTKTKTLYIFNIKNINIEELNKIYNLKKEPNLNISDNYPINITKITDLEINNDNIQEIIPFLDESKRKIMSNISIINFKDSVNKNYKCFWEHELIPEGIVPIGCPINYYHNKLKKNYFSEITQDNFSIKEDIINSKEKILKKENVNLSIIDKNYYETDGFFCSFNCCVSFIQNNSHNPMYNNSYTLLLKLYSEIFNVKIKKIEPAPSYRKLMCYGGDLTIEKFRESFNKIHFKEHGIIKIPNMESIGILYEKQFKF
jgi:hypothetical protein